MAESSPASVPPWMPDTAAWKVEVVAIPTPRRRARSPVSISVVWRRSILRYVVGVMGNTSFSCLLVAAVEEIYVVRGEDTWEDGCTRGCDHNRHLGCTSRWVC